MYSIMITIMEYFEPTDLVLLPMQFIHMEPWNLKEPLMINDDFCDIIIQIEGTDNLKAECCGYISLVTLEQFQNIVDRNPVGDSGEPIVQDLLENMDGFNAVYVLPNFVGAIKGTSGSYLNGNGHDWSEPYYVSLPKGTVLESSENTRKRLKIT